MPADVQGVQVLGLMDLRRILKQTGDKDLPKQLQQANKRAAEIVARAAAAKVPVRTGRTRKSVRGLATQGVGRVRGGGAAVPWYGWLDFGGRRRLPYSHVKEGAPSRPVIRTGRYIYPALHETRDEVAAIYAKEIDDLLRRSFGRTGTHG